MARTLKSAVTPDVELRTNGDSSTPVVSLSPPKRRRPSWVLLGVIMVGLAALLGAYVLTAVSDRLSVLVAAVDLQPGEPIGTGDLRVVEMGRTDELRAIQPDQQDLILGRSPTGLIPAGTVLNTGLFVALQDVVPAGQVVIGGAFQAGAVPTAALGPGDDVVLLGVQADLGSPDPAAIRTAEVIGTGTVWAVEGVASTDSSGRVWVSLLVPEGIQSAAAQAAADDRLRLSLTRPG